MTKQKVCNKKRAVQPSFISFTPISIPCQARIYRFLEKTKKNNALSDSLEETPGDIMKERERLRKKVKMLMKKQRLLQVRKIVR